MKVVKQLKRSNAKHWPEIAKEALTALWQAGDDGKLTVEVDKETRRDKQNKLMWVMHTALAKHTEEHTGNIFEPEDIHEYIARKLLGKKAVTFPDGDIAVVRNRTSELSVADFADFLTRYYVHAQEVYQCILPRPDDLYWDALMLENKQQETDGL